MTGLDNWGHAASNGRENGTLVDHDLIFPGMLYG
jgi:hypothetical protein